MTRNEGALRLLAFAAGFIHGIDHYSEVRTEQLAEAFRQCFGLPPFPSLEDLEGLCQSIGLAIDRPVSMPETLPGANVWHGSTSPVILLHPDLSRRFAETTLGHELRELIESAFKQAKPTYQGLDTSDNRR